MVTGEKREYIKDVSSLEKKNFILEMIAISESGVKSDVRKVFVKKED